MKHKIALALTFLLAAGCMQEYPEQPGGGNDKACNFAAFESVISVEYRASSIPSKLSANVNGMPVVNECTLGNDNDSYLTVRNGDKVTILLRVGRNAALTEMFFNEDGTPRSNIQFQFVLKGRESCGDTAGQIYATARTLDWKPVYSNSNTSCGPSGYMATVSN
jgi:hypothetical protein